MGIRVIRRQRQTGFTLLEMMVAVAVIGVLAAVAIPLMTRYQLRSKTAEAKTNLGAIRVLEESYYGEKEAYLVADAEPPAIPGSVAATFDAVNSDFAPLGFVPEGRVYFSYGVAVSGDSAGFTADAGADIDGDGFVQYWGYAKPDASGVPVGGKVGCNTAGMQPESVGPCSPNFGQTIF